MKNSAGPVKAFLFDLDDTLYDCTGQLVDSARHRAAAAMVRAGLPLREQDAYARIVEITERYGPRTNVFDMLCEQYDVDLSVAEAGLNAYNAESDEPVYPFPDTIPVLAELRKKHQILMVTTGVWRRQNWKLDQLGIRGLFDEIIINDLRSGKPKDECFRRLLENRGLEAQNVVCVGDRIHSEIKIANRMGMRTVRMLHGRYSSLPPDNELEEPDFTIENLRQLLLVPGRIGRTDYTPKTLYPHISQNFVARAWRVLLQGCKLVKRRSSRIDILQSGVLPICALAVVLSALAVGIL
jgi:HAD superfamily hydrolase (TIGR01509 family)